MCNLLLDLLITSACVAAVVSVMHRLLASIGADLSRELREKESEQQLLKWMKEDAEK